ncbi:MAG: hypothetical protein KDB14_17515 [Planctomycetales bacterium]|nr:hypothetical protein [Planctomycetales bacterium]
MKVRELAKWILVLTLIPAAIGCYDAWTNGLLAAQTQGVQYGTLAICVLCLAGLVKLARTADKAPDYLAKILPRHSRYFDRDGLCFVLDVGVAADGACHLLLYFQNRHDRRCEAHLVVRATRNYMKTSGTFVTPLEVYVECPEGGYGVTEIPLALPATAEGRELRIEFGMDVAYPEGRGTLLRFKEGSPLRTNGQFRHDSWTTNPFIRLCLALGGAFTWSTPPSLEFMAPEDLKGAPQKEAPPHTTILWQLGEPALVEPEDWQARH